MAVTVTRRKRTNAAALKLIFATLTFDATYDAGGETLTPSDYGMKVIDFVMVLAVSGGLVGQWDRANSKMKLLYPTGSTVAAPAAIGDPIVAAGGTPVTGTNADGRFTAGRGKELLANTDASLVTMEVLVFGH